MTGGESRDVVEYACPDIKCDDRGDLEEVIEGCRGALGAYENTIEELRREKGILSSKISAFLEGSCETGPGMAAAKIDEVVWPESVRSFSVFVISESRQDPVTALYRYVRENVRFVGDPNGKEYLASPCETILTSGGDCEDHAVLLASMFESVGFDSVIISVPDHHVFVGVDVGGRDVEGLCEDPLWMEHGGKNLLLADTTASNCIGGVNGDFIQKGEAGWSWRQEPLIIDV